MLISVNQIEESTKRYSFLQEKPIKDNFSNLSEEVFINQVSPGLNKDAINNADKNLLKRKEMLEAVSPEPVDFGLERVIGKNDSLYSNFVGLIEIVKRKLDGWS